MKKIVVMAFLAGLVAGVLATLGVVGLERAFVSPRDAAILRLKVAHAGQGRQSFALARSARPGSGSILQAVAPSLRQRVAPVVLRECILPSDASIFQTPVKIQDFEANPDQPRADTAEEPALVAPSTPAANATLLSPSQLFESAATASTHRVGERTEEGKDGAPDLLGASSAAVYARAFALYESGRYAQSRDAFDAFARAFPRNSLVPNALYWIGETWYAQQRFARAGEAFALVPSRYPRHAKSADALLKQAYSALRSGNPTLARRLLDRLDAGYPGSRASILGREALRAMRGRAESGSQVTARG